MKLATFLTCLTALIIIPAVSASRPTPSDEKRYTAIVRVRADDKNNGWTDSRFILRKGQHVSFEAAGNVQLEEGVTSTPDGIEDKRELKKLLSDAPLGALIAVVGRDNDAFLIVGSKREIVVQRDGILFLGVNEEKLKDNIGSYFVTIKTDSPPTNYSPPDER
jgi:hypothetical protein